MMSEMKRKAQEPITLTRLKFWAAILSAGFVAGGAFAVDQARDIIDSSKVEELVGDVEAHDTKLEANRDAVEEVKGDVKVIKNDVEWIRKAIEKEHG